MDGMGRRILGLVLIFAGSALGVQAAEELRWKSGAESVRAGQPAESIGPASLRRNLDRLARGEIGPHVVVRFDPERAGVSAAAREVAQTSGLQLLKPIGQNAYFAIATPGINVERLRALPDLFAVQAIRPEWKIEDRLTRAQPPAVAVIETPDEGAPRVGLYVLFHEDVPLDTTAKDDVERLGGELLVALRSVHGAVIALPYDRVTDLATLDGVRWIETPLPPLSGTNDDNRMATQVEELQINSAYALDGSGVVVLLYDGGVLDPNHPDFGARVTIRDDANIQSHATHVGGTIGGDGFASGGLHRGMAPGVLIESFGFQTGFPFTIEGDLFTNPGDLESDYDEAINDLGTVLANNSIGTNTCSNGFDCTATGNYGVTSQLIDAIIGGSLGGSLGVVWAVGNERSCERCAMEGVVDPRGYRSIAPPAGAKNHIAVGAINSNDDTITSFTSWGPTDDGRLKPDLVAPGCQYTEDFGVTSPVIQGGYAALCGTSMSAPTVTGSLALMLQEFRSQFPGAAEPTNAMWKAILLQTTEDIEEPGPDFKSGYGALRARDAVDFLRTGQFQSASVAQDTSYSVFLNVEPGTPELKLTLAWDDAPGAPNVLPALVNDLDLRVFSPGSVRHFPWTLDPGRPAERAVRTQPDRRNNVEQVVVTAPEAGLWLVQVFGHSIPADPQSFALCHSHPIEDDCNENGTADDEEIAGNPALDCSGNGLLDACEPDCDEDGTADSCALDAGDDTDCNRDAVPDSCEPLLDCNANGVRDACEVANGDVPDCDENLVPDACDPDCDGDGAIDACELAEGTAVDCDQDGIPDECQPLIDCNNNGMHDPCEIAAGLVEDFNDDGFPDECQPSGNVFHVDGANCPGPGDGSAGNPYCLIQDAIDQSISGDTVLIHPGVYQGPRNRNLDYGGRLITVQSTDPTDPSVVASTIIDCQQQGRGFYFHDGESAEAVLAGLTITNGLAAQGSVPGDFKGGAVYCRQSSPTIRHCRFVNNETGVALVQVFGGGAIHCEKSSPTIEDCEFTDNLTQNFGGGVYCFDASSPQIRRCTFRGNTAFVGAGIAARQNSHPLIENCEIIDNTTITSGVGGGVSFSLNSHAELRNSVIARNTAHRFAGGIHVSLDSLAEIHGVTVVENHGAEKAGGIYVHDGAQPLLQNSIFWGNTGGDALDQIAVGNNAQLAVSHCDVEGDLAEVTIEFNGAIDWGAGNLSADPQFADQANEDYHLTAGSPCVDAGVPFTLPVGGTDIDGEPRQANCRTDIGADESPFAADCNANSLPDGCETAASPHIDCDRNAVPDSCEDTTEDCNANGAWDACDILAGDESDCNANGVPDSCELADGSASDCNANMNPDACDIAAETSADHNGNGVPDECEECTSDSDCLDGVYCNGQERCENGVCVNGALPCPPSLVCDEPTDECVQCLADTDCHVINECRAGQCIDNVCEQINLSGPCDDGEFCTENDQCLNGFCVGELIPGCGAAMSLRAAAVNGQPLPGGASPIVTVDQGDRVTIEAYVSGWGPQLLRGFNFVIDDDSYGTGLIGSLAPLRTPTPATGAFVDQSRTDYVFHGRQAIVSVQAVDPDFYQYLGVLIFNSDCVTDVDLEGYIGTLVLETDGAAGEFTVCMNDTDANNDLNPEQSFIRDCNGAGIIPIEFACTTIVVVMDCNDNGIPDDEDIAAGTSADCTMNHVPDECEPDCDNNGTADSCDIAAGDAVDCNGNQVPDACDIAQGTSRDCNDNGIPDDCEPDCNGNGLSDACEILEGTSSDCNRNGLPDECEDCDGNGLADECDLQQGAPDCNKNNIPDACDVIGDTQRDCDANGVPDECQDTSLDCNDNGLWDACDMAKGVPDCNENGIPDVCDIDSGFSRDCDFNGAPDECPDYFPNEFRVSALDGKRGVQFLGVTEGDLAGRVATSAGDINGDGFIDFMISASDAEAEESSRTGEVYVLFGGQQPWPEAYPLAAVFPPSGNVPTVARRGFVMSGLADGDALGRGLDSAGDFNGDGIGDIIIGAPDIDLGEEGNEINGVGGVFVVFGRPGLGESGSENLAALDGTDGFRVNGAEEEDSTGYNVAGIGDINGDDLDDVLVSAHTATVNGVGFVGRAYVLFGRTEPWPAEFSFASLFPENGGDGSLGFVVVGSNPDDTASATISAAGDVNNDGYDDFLVGSWSAGPVDRPFAGLTWLIFGGPGVGAGGAIHLSELAFPQGVTFEGIDQVDLSADSLADIGDFNNDGIDDFIIGAVWGDPNATTNAGEAYVIYGHAGPWPDVFELRDLLPQNGGDGSAGVVFEGSALREFAGGHVASPGDINADGFRDLMIGAAGADYENGVDQGRVYVLYGRPDPWPAVYQLSTLLEAAPPELADGFVVRGSAAGDSLGLTVGAAGDVNDDGVSDMLMSSWVATAGDQEGAGVCYLIFGRYEQPRDCNNNAVVDQCDILDVVSRDCDDNNIPDECQGELPDCNDTGLWDVCDIADDVSRDCNQNLIPDECEEADGTAENCNGNEILDECETDEPADCNANNTWDACDIYSGASADCNENAVPDECEPGGTTDCNENEATDICDITFGESKDQNANGVPDECEPLVTIYVDTNGCDADTGGTGTADDPYCTIQQGVSSAGGGADAVIEVVLADGVYFGPGNTDVDFSAGLPEGETRAITVRSANGPANCVIDGDDLAPNLFVFDSGEGPGARVEGLTLIRARRGAVECIEGSSPTLHRCVFTRNWAIGGGAGVRCSTGSPTISFCTFAGNGPSAVSALVQSHPRIINSLIAGNIAVRGAGVRVGSASSAVIDRTTLVRNEASFRGGAVYNDSFGRPNITNSILYDNPPQEVTGLMLIRHSDVKGDHPGIGNFDLAPALVGGPTGTWTAEPLRDPDTRTTTLFDDDANWMENQWAGLLIRPIVDTPVGLEYVIAANTSNTVTIWGDELELVASGDTYQIMDNRLSPESPAINAGDIEFTTFAPTTDLDGDQRVRHCRIDAGAYESDTPVDCDGNGATDACEALAGELEDCDGNAVPDVCDPDCDENGLVDACETADNPEIDINNSGVPDLCEIEFCDVDNNGLIGFNDIKIMNLCKHREMPFSFDLCKFTDIDSNGILDQDDLDLFEACVEYHVGRELPYFDPKHRRPPDDSRLGDDD